MSSFLAPASPFDPPSLLYTLRTQPGKSLVRALDLTFALLRSSPAPDSLPIRVVCISDTHCLKPPHVPAGDLLIHAGDLTKAGTPAELQAQIDWLDSLPHEHKVVIAGNHDTWLDPRSRQTLDTRDQEGGVEWKGLHYLQHSVVTLPFFNGRRELKLYGAPQIPACGGEAFAFQYPRGHDAWSETVPEDIDVLVTHTPPKHHLDLPAALGCEHLLSEVWRVWPRLHVFGHIHAGRSEAFSQLRGGKEVVRWCEGQRCVERALSRSDGLIRGLLDPRGWLDVLKVLCYSAAGVLWDRIWGGAGGDATIMVNASLMYNNTGQLRNAAQVVEI
ncbi:hypothetical protein LTR08_005461 [Meristemomyces frigidus]|nr:hypothetical protein LTR08_005461 [Meristemomyces frigidus]